MSTKNSNIEKSPDDKPIEGHIEKNKAPEDKPIREQRPQTQKEQEKSLDSQGENDSEDRDLPQVANNELEEAPELAELIERDPKTIATIRRVVEHSSGPLPPPKALAGYEETLPGAANRIVTMAEEEQSYRHKMTEKSIKNNNRHTARGQYMGFILVLVLIGASVYLALKGYSDLSKTIVTTTIIGVSIVFVLNRIPYFFGRNNKDKDNE